MGVHKFFVVTGTTVAKIERRSEMSHLICGGIAAGEKYNLTHDNIALIWRGDPLIRSAVAVNDSKLYLKYSSLVDQYKRDGFGIYYDGRDMSKLLPIIDAYYGDVDRVIQKCRSRKIPVMIQNVEV